MNFPKLFVIKNPSFEKCPNCSGFHSLHRSRARTIVEEIVKTFTFMKYFKCKSCGWRGIKSNIGLTKSTFFALLVYGLLIIVVSWVITSFLQRYVG
ncbi:MAG: hypothetical protein C0425_09225 [Chlorobiaceae bacterium]|nr:hypothetical protein [Chlorobiaceae bacterium]MBA4310503.1 hypothetical protein [Chlorobiaceae bacterium]